MTRDDLSGAIKAKRAELEALETEAMTLPFTTGDNNKLSFVHDAIMYLYSELGGERQPEQCSNDHRVRFKLIETLDKRIEALEATTRNDLADDGAPDAVSPTRRMLDGWVAGLSPLSNREITAMIDHQAAMIAKLKADLANAYIPPEGYEVISHYALGSSIPVEPLLMPKGGAK